jgi:hypothetical protein
MQLADLVEEQIKDMSNDEINRFRDELIRVLPNVILQAAIKAKDTERDNQTNELVDKNEE